MGFLRYFARYSGARILFRLFARGGALLGAVVALLLLPANRCGGPPLLAQLTGALARSGAAVAPASTLHADRRPARRDESGLAPAGAGIRAHGPRASAEEVCFGPEGRCGEVMVQEVSRARKAVRAQFYTFTAPDIAKALAQARREGRDVAVILDASEVAKGKESYAIGLLRAGAVLVRFDAAHTIAHNKVVVIDDDEVLTGSFNASVAAERDSAENLLVLRGDPALARAYLKNWTYHFQHSKEGGP